MSTDRARGETTPADVVLVGVSHRTVPVEVRERLARALAHDRQSLIEAVVPEHASEVVLISTCNRLEICCVPTGSASELEGSLISWLASAAGLSFDELNSAVYRKKDREAVLHLFRVICGLDSQVLGETQILGQISQLFIAARSEGTIGPLLTLLLSRAVHTGKRARAETRISHGKTSISRAAATLVEAELRGLEGKIVILIGVGETALLVLDALRAGGGPRVVCVNRSLARAQAVAEAGCEVLPWSALGGALVTADAVVTATSSPHPVLRVEDMLPLLDERAGRPLLLVDIAVPRDIDSLVGELPSVALYDIDDLEVSLDEGRSLRAAAVPRVEEIVREETDAVMEWLCGRRVAPLVREFRERARSIADEEAYRALGKLDGLDARERDVVLRLARQVANKILHEPTVHLKSLARESDGMRYLETFMEMFGLGLETRGGDSEGCRADLCPARLGGACDRAGKVGGVL